MKHLSAFLLGTHIVNECRKGSDFLATRWTTHEMCIIGNVQKSEV